MKRASLAFVLAVMATFVDQPEASAQIQNQPVEIVEATPLSSFSERSGTWPSQEIPEERLTIDRSDFSERLNAIPGLQARANGSPVFSIRGSGQADRTLRLFEGLPLNMADGVGASEFLLPVEAIGSLSLIKGPASVFYGGSAMAGALDHRMRFYERNALRLSGSEEGKALGPRSLFGAAVLPGGSTLERGQVTLFHERNPGRFPFTSTSTTQSGRRENNASDLSRATLAADAKAGPVTLRLRGLAAKSVGETPGSLHAPLNSSFDTTVELASLEARRDFESGDFLSLRATDSRLWGLYDRDTAFQSTSFSSRSSLSVDSRTNVAGSGLRTFGDLITQTIAGTYLGDARFHQFD
ncbi:MAG: TonB-dependent receptor plug domain-containing protein, partial [Bdellovibrionota bacterium]